MKTLFSIPDQMQRSRYQRKRKQSSKGRKRRRKGRSEEVRMIRQTEFLCSVIFCYIKVFSTLLFTILGKKNIIHYKKFFITEVMEDLSLRHKQMRHCEYSLYLVGRYKLGGSENWTYRWSVLKCLHCFSNPCRIKVDRRPQAWRSCGSIEMTECTVHF